MTSIVTVAATTLALLQTPAFQVQKVRDLPAFRPIAYASAPTGRQIVACMEDKSVRIIDPETRMTLRTLSGHPQPAYAVAWSPDGNTIATGDESARIMFWNAKTGAKIREVRTHQRGISKLSFSRNSAQLLSTSKDDSMKIWDVKTGKELRTILGKGRNLYGGTFLPNRDLIASGTLGTSQLLLKSNGDSFGTLSNEFSQGTFDVAYNAAGSRFATADRGGVVFFWDGTTNKRLGSFKGHNDWVVDVEFSPNGRWLASGSSDGTVCVWNIYNFQAVSKLDGQSYIGSPLTWTADGRYLMTVTDQGFMQINSVTPAQPAVAPAPPKKAPAKRR